MARATGPSNRCVTTVAAPYCCASAASCRQRSGPPSAIGLHTSARTTPRASSRSTSLVGRTCSDSSSASGKARSTDAGSSASSRASCSGSSSSSIETSGVRLASACSLGTASARVKARLPSNRSRSVGPSCARSSFSSASSASNWPGRPSFTFSTRRPCDHASCALASSCSGVSPATKPDTGTVSTAPPRRVVTGSCSCCPSKSSSAVCTAQPAAAGSARASTRCPSSTKSGSPPAYGSSVTSCVNDTICSCARHCAKSSPEYPGSGDASPSP